MRQLLAIFAVAVLSTSVTAVGAAATALNGKDRQVVLQLSNQIKAYGRTAEEVGPSVFNETFAAVRRCSGFKKYESVADSVAIAVVVLNSTYRTRGQIRSVYRFIRAQRFNDPVLRRWLASLKKGVILGERSGLLDRPVNGPKLCAILGEVYRHVVSGKLPPAKVGDKVHELAGVNMRLVHASAATFDARQAMRPQVEPLFRSAGLSAPDAGRLADY